MTDSYPPAEPGTAGPVEGVVVQGQELADLVATAVLRVPGVARLHPGRFGEVVTLLPGRRVSGVRVRPAVETVAGPGVRTEGVEVALVVTPARPLPDVVADVREALGLLTAGPVDVLVADLEVTPVEPPAEPSLHPASGSTPVDPAPGPVAAPGPAPHDPA
ncbi:hypothetical protein ACFFKU_14030 [Kineococcus gynurae]|uniref:Alkaline shock family protein YloU n=1 Tax=Kineococcus gynurae TaxID=452979 RepID=A0ABV5LU81_9ACTN